MKVVGVQEFLKLKKEAIPVLDTRSPAEFLSGHIPGSVSFPLFNNEERATIGTIYKQENKKKAIKTGLEMIGPKMTGFIEKAEALGSTSLLMHCWRGGMRSQSMAWLLELYGFNIQLLQGGYKAFRNALLDYFDAPPALKILSGATGSMKTSLLHEMQSLGAQVVDLEKLANHQGSSFGYQLSSGQPSTEQFQNDLFEAFLQLDQSQPIWLEDESFSIGKVKLIEPLYRKMQLSPHYLVMLPKEERIAVLVESYGKIPRENLVQATWQISKRLGQESSREAVEKIQSGKLEEAAAIILTYYDKAYKTGIQKKASQIVGEFHLTIADLREMAKKLINH
ncbi:tRNA 2-selenouridine(34) synthase MnmH [Cyclobacterium plantarum]|uniref:tRNA 2-selenouridine(34) synthase MnmH n=1 Tax=Cyclobacterium plantarum TaxID=2716263 RepID=A0ABX0H1G1_9BACT|nr:tRNA 2-selenouridine(34) synthase MnmH [Cyclobacterium plantarum]NHE55240.1 tRNA 2-selenouridine(34) synthase MnmH [Cyclobacterium plantarum]